MNTTIENKYKWFWAWQDEQEEAWLTEMAAEGLHLEYVSFPGRYQFRKGEQANYIYRLDYQTLKKQDRESYLQLFIDAGWEHVGNMAGWEYFRKPDLIGDAPEIYSDTESKIKKYYRIMIYLVIFLPILITVMPDAIDRHKSIFLILQGVFAVLMLFYGYAMIRLFLRINQLKSKG